MSSTLTHMCSTSPWLLITILSLHSRAWTMSMVIWLGEKAYTISVDLWMITKAANRQVDRTGWPRRWECTGLYPEVVQKVHKRLVASYTAVRKKQPIRSKEGLWYHEQRGPLCGVLYCSGQNSPVDYWIKLVGVPGNLVIHRNHLKLCYEEPNPLPQKPKRNNLQPVTSGQIEICQPAPANSKSFSAVGGYTCSDNSRESAYSRNSWLKWNRRPLGLYSDVVSY